VVLQGFADRVATDWAGSAAFIARRKMMMKASVYPGDILTGTGRVTRVTVQDGRRYIDLAITLRTGSGPVCDVETTILLPLSES
jgi:acyl dehydratase